MLSCYQCEKVYYGFFSQISKSSELIVLKRDLITFDLDGTLVDTVPSIFEALNQCRNQYDLPAVDIFFVKVHVGLPVSELFQDVKNEVFVTSILVPSFRKILLGIQLTQNALYAGTLPLLNIMSENGFSLSVATSKPTYLAEKTLEMTGLTKFFELVVGTDNNLHKPHPWVLHETRRICGQLPRLMIGDRVEDAGAALAAEVPFIAVLQSTHTAEDFLPFGPIGIYNSTLELFEKWKIESVIS
jgi:phosphoglycolate phosphatase